MKKLSLALVLVLFVLGTALAQRTVSGIVSDNQGEALIGANILVKGTTTGTVTDIEGKYSVAVPDGSTTLVISYTGYATQEFELGASNVVDIVLKEGAVLDEVVVTAVGLEANKRTLGYAVQNVNADEVVGSREVNLVNALNSKVAGVSVVSSSGSPGASANIRIRGSVSINGTNSPLFVVDGVPIDNSESFNNDDDDTGDVDNSNRAIDINPNDIASMTVLKGPAATALYGVRAANGAIIITPTTRKAGKPTVNITSTFSIDRVNKLNDRQSTFAQGRPSGGAPIWRGPETTEGFSWGPRISELEFDGATDYPFDTRG
ncbi:MAG: carboxypeptidase-like regulatory domain-containing protein, partial [Bacteroidota bacterium]